MAESVRPDGMLAQAQKREIGKQLLREAVLLVATIKNPHAQAMAKARAAKLTPERKSEIARKAAKARWAKKKRKKKHE